MSVAGQRATSHWQNRRAPRSELSPAVGSRRTEGVTESKQNFPRTPTHVDGLTSVRLRDLEPYYFSSSGSVGNSTASESRRSRWDPLAKAGSTRQLACAARPLVSLKVVKA